MEPLLQLLNGLSGWGWVLVLIIVIFRREWIDKVFGLLARNGGGETEEHLTNGKQEQINIDLFKHAETANQEMGRIDKNMAVMESRMSRMESDVQEIKQDIKILLRK